MKLKTIYYLLFVIFFGLNIDLKAQINTILNMELWLTGDSVHVSSNIDTIYDLSPLKNHAVQSSSSSRPTSLISTNLNGHKVISFDAIDDYLLLPQIDFRTIFVVAKTYESPSSEYRGLIGGLNSSVSVGGYLLNCISGSEEIALGIGYSDFTSINKNSIATSPMGNLSPINNYWLGTFVYNSNRNQIAEIGRIDAGNSPNRYWKGEIAEIIVFSRSLSNIETNQIEQYLYDKYAPPIQLPSDITVTNSYCDTTVIPIIINNNQYTNFQWSTGATTHTISVNKSGKYWLNATNMFGKQSSDTIFITFPDYNQPLQNSICLNDSLLWNTNFSKSQYTFHWQDNSTDSLFTIKQAGNYYVKITDSFGCNITSDTVKITIDNFSNTTSLGSDLSLCSGNSITLTSGMLASYSYTWSTGSNNDSLLITNAGQYSVIVTNTNNCVAKDTIDVTIQGIAPTANFSSNIGCVNQMVSFTDLSIPPSGNTISNYEWNFGDIASPTNTSTVSNPSHTYTNTGTYTVNLTVITNSNCEQSIIKTINVYPVPTATFSFGTSCQNDSTTFLNQSTGITGYSITSSYWNFGDFPSPTYTSNVISPKHTFTNVLTYSVTLMVTNSVGCASSVIKTITPKYEVKANFTNGPACANSATNFQSTSIIPPSGTSTYDWNFGNSTSNVQSPSKTYTNSGIYYVTLNVDGQNGCTSTITKLVNVYLPPVANFSIPSFCSKDTINAINLSNAQSGIITSYDWKLNNVSFSAAQNPTLSVTTPTTYSVKLDVINSFGCKDSKTYSLTIFPLPTVDFSTTPVAFYYVNEAITYTPSITNASSYLWNMNGASTYTNQSPTETFNTEGLYTISLNLKDQNGCKGSKTKNITVSKRYLDLAVLNVSTTKDNDGFMTVVADIANYGSVPINSFKLGYQISDGGNIKETWNGTLNPNSFYTFTFNATSASLQNSSNNITCAEIENVNTIIDDNATNNSFCSSLNTDDIYVANPLPNPTNGDIVLPITLNRGFDYTIAIYNSVGQIQYEETTKKGIEGLNFVTLSTSSYARGAYIIKVMIDDKIFIKKFIKVSYE